VKNLGSLSLYAGNVCTDINTAVHFLTNGDYYWGGLILAFTLLPMIISGIVVFRFIINQDVSVWGKCFALLLVIIVAPFIPFGTLLWVTIDGIRGIVHGDDDEMTTAEFAGVVKLLEALGQSFPQALIQCFIASQNIQAGVNVGLWLWASIALSLIGFSFTVATSDFFDWNKSEDNKVSNITRITWFVFGLLAFTSRILVASVISMALKPLWFVPISTLFASAIVVWTIKRYCPCNVCGPLNDGHRNKTGIFTVPLMWLITTSYNAFTMSALVVSTMNLGQAIGGYFLDVPLPIAVTALTISSVSWATNVVFATVPKFERTRNDWLGITDNGSVLY
ncbi:unnamed protein product, partial [Meganyctiphanes norvegica]